MAFAWRWGHLCSVKYLHHKQHDLWGLQVGARLEQSFIFTAGKSPTAETFMEMRSWGSERSERKWRKDLREHSWFSRKTSVDFCFIMSPSSSWNPSPSHRQTKKTLVWSQSHSLCLDQFLSRPTGRSSARLHTGRSLRVGYHDDAKLCLSLCWESFSPFHFIHKFKAFSNFVFENIKLELHNDGKKGNCHERKPQRYTWWRSSQIKNHLFFPCYTIRLSWYYNDSNRGFCWHQVYYSLR